MGIEVVFREVTKIESIIIDINLLQHIVNNHQD